MSVFFALDMTIVQHVVCKKMAILLSVSNNIFSNLVTKSTHSDLNPV
jgi:hypothetical protein